MQGGGGAEAQKGLSLCPEGTLVTPRSWEPLVRRKAHGGRPAALPIGERPAALVPGASAPFPPRRTPSWPRERSAIMMAKTEQYKG